MFKKRKWGFVILAAFALSACASDEQAVTEESAETSSEMPGAGMDSAVENESNEGTEEGATMPAQGGRVVGEKVIRNVYVEYETLDFQETTEQVDELISEYDAYIEFSNESTTSDWDVSGQNYRNITYTLRVPTESLDVFLEELEELAAYKKAESVGTEDVTQRYRDTEARINVLQNKEERLTALLEQAESIEAIIEVEDSLSETIAERESLQSILESYDSLIDYTEVQLFISERPRLSDSGGEDLPFFERVGEAFRESMYGFYYFLQNLIIWIIYAIPFLIIIGLIALAVYLVRKRMKKN